MLLVCILERNFNSHVMAEHRYTTTETHYNQRLKIHVLETVEHVDPEQYRVCISSNNNVYDYDVGRYMYNQYKLNEKITVKFIKGYYSRKLYYDSFEKLLSGECN